MLKFAPILLAVLYGFFIYHMSAQRLRKELDHTSTRLRDAKLLGLSERMAAVLDLPKINVFVHEVEPINGLAAPDGRIFITRGFLNKYATGVISAEELASVIAHELGHVALGHARRRMIDFSTQNAMRAVMVMLLGRFIPLIGPLIANVLTRLLAAKLSRKDEYEADAYAAALMIKSGIGIEAQISLFQKLDRLIGVGGGAPAWMMSHPKTTDRIAAIQKMTQEG